MTLLGLSSVVLGLTPLVVIVVIVVTATLRSQRRGYRFGSDVIVRCREGHVFTTIWIPGVSFKAIKLGWIRFQHCPVGNHWTFVTPIADDDLTEEDRVLAAQYRDTPIP